MKLDIEIELIFKDAQKVKRLFYRPFKKKHKPSSGRSGKVKIFSSLEISQYKENNG